MQERFDYDLIPAGSRVLCALSGGADSMYLLCRLAEGAERGKYSLRAAHYNHHLRESALRDEDFVRRWCLAHGIPLTVGGGAVAEQAARSGQGMEETARQMRYAFLEETARQEGCTHIATGHHRGDQVETVLMHLLRGSGGRGLGGIPRQRGIIIRPMLELGRADIEDYLAARQIPHVEDESNALPHCTRNRVRHQLLPLLRELNPRAEDHILDAAARLREDEALLSRMGEDVARQTEVRGRALVLPVERLTCCPRPVALRALAQLMARMGGRGEAVHLEGLLALCARPGPARRLDLPGCTARCEQGLLWLSPPEREQPLPVLTLSEGRVCWGEWTMELRSARCPSKAFVSREEFYLRPGRYQLRPRRPGDRLALGSRPHKRVKDLMAEDGIPAHLRAHWPVVATEEGPAALGGFGPAREWLAQPGQPALRMILKRRMNDDASGCGTDSVYPGGAGPAGG